MTKFFDIKYNINIKDNVTEKTELELREEKNNYYCFKNSIEFFLNK